MREKIRALALLVAVMTIGCAGAGEKASMRGSSDSYSPAYALATHSEETVYEFEGEEVSSEPRAERSQRAPAGPEAPPGSDVVDRKLVKNAWLHLEVDDEDDFEPTIRRIEQVAAELEGYVVSTSRQSAEIKVPADRIDEAIARIGGVGELADYDLRAEDVTARYVDLGIQIDNLRKTRASLQKLLSQAQSVTETLEVEKELRRVTMQLEQLEGQMRLLRNQTTFATIRVSLEEAVTPGPIGWVFYGAYHAVKWLFVWD